jgi:hypothetical protein
MLQVVRQKIPAVRRAKERNLKTTKLDHHKQRIQKKSYHLERHG